MSNRCMEALAMSGLALVISLAVAPSRADQDDKKAESTPAEKGKQADLPDLDDMLGLPSKRKPQQSRAEDAAPAEAQPDDSDALELERKLSAEELADKFRDAVRQMGEAADRIDRGRDVGLVTQRLQDEILKKLDVLVKQSEQNQGGSSGEQQQQSESQQSQGSRQRPPSQGNRQGEQSQAGDAENRGEAMPPPGQDPEFRRQLDTARAAWGNLPERVRESLMQGSGDYFSALYEAMTEAYYKKIAEEGEDR